MFFCGGRLLRSVGHDVHLESLHGARGGRVARLGVGGQVSDAPDPEVSRDADLVPRDLVVDRGGGVVEASTNDQAVSRRHVAGEATKQADGVTNPIDRYREGQVRHWPGVIGGGTAPEVPQELGTDRCLVAAWVDRVVRRLFALGRTPQFAAAACGLLVLQAGGKAPAVVGADRRRLRIVDAVDRVVSPIDGLPVADQPRLVRVLWNSTCARIDAGAVLLLGDEVLGGLVGAEVHHHPVVAVELPSWYVDPSRAAEAVVDRAIAVVIESVADLDARVPG